MNKAFFIGNLTRDPEIGETPNGVTICHFSLAVNRNYTNSEGERPTDFFNVTCWRGLAESVAKHCVKGNKVAVTGSVQLRVWEDNDGVKHQSVDVIAQDVEFLTPKDKKNDETTAPAKKKPALELFDHDGDIPF